MNSLIKSLFFKSSFLLIVIIFLNKFLGFIEKIVLAHYFGTSEEADVFIVAQNLFISGWLIIEEIISPALIPVLTLIKGNDSENKKISITHALIIIIIPFCIVFAVCTNFFQDLIANLLFPGFSIEKRLVLKELWRYFSIATILFFVTPILQAYANSKKLFLIPAASNLLGRILMILTVVIGIGHLGIKSTGIGMILYSFLYFSLLLIFLKFPIITRFKKLYSHLEYKEFISLLIPLVIGFIFSQMVQWVDIHYASKFSTGSLSALTYAKKLIDAPVLIISFCIGTVLLPYLSSFIASKDSKMFSKYFNSSIFICAFFYSLLMIVYLVFSPFIIKTIYAHGKFGASSVLLTSHILKYYAPGLLVFSIEIIIMQASFAARNHWKAILVGAICSLLNVFGTIIFFPKFGIVIIPIAAISQKLLKSTILYFLLRRKLARDFLFNETLTCKTESAALSASIQLE